MTALEPTRARLSNSGAELTALAEHFCLRAFAAGALFCSAAAVSAIAMLPLRDSASPVPWSTPTVVLTGLLAVAALVAACVPGPVYRALTRRPAFELVAVVVAAALLAYPLRSELWWPSCALLMLVAHIAPLTRTWAYCVAVLVTNLLAHALAGDLTETPAVSIIGLWIGFGFWATLTGLVIDRIASYLMRLDVGHSGVRERAPTAPPAPAASESPASEPSTPPAQREPPLAEATEAVAVVERPSEPASVAPAAPVSDSAQARDDRILALTKRQLEVTALLADGLRYEAIAACLSISRRQVQRHVTGAVERLGVHNANELVTVAVSSGLVPPRDVPPVPD